VASSRKTNCCRGAFLRSFTVEELTFGSKTYEIGDITVMADGIKVEFEVAGPRLLRRDQVPRPARIRNNLPSEIVETAQKTSATQSHQNKPKAWALRLPAARVGQRAADAAGGVQSSSTVRKPSAVQVAARS